MGFFVDCSKDVSDFVFFGLDLLEEGSYGAFRGFFQHGGRRMAKARLSGIMSRWSLVTAELQDENAFLPAGSSKDAHRPNHFADANDLLTQPLAAVRSLTCLLQTTSNRCPMSCGTAHSFYLIIVYCSEVNILVTIVGVFCPKVRLFRPRFFSDFPVQKGSSGRRRNAEYVQKERSRNTLPIPLNTAIQNRMLSKFVPNNRRTII